MNLNEIKGPDLVVQAIRHYTKDGSDYEIDTEWMNDDIQLYINNDKNLYNGMYNTRRPAHSVAYDGLLYALNSVAGQKFTSVQVKSGFRKLGLDFKEVLKPTVQWIEEEREERKQELQDVDTIEESKEESSSYKQKFIDYCKDKVEDLGVLLVKEDDEEPVDYKVLMTDSNYAQANGTAYILSDPDNEWERLIIADKDGNIFIDSPMSIPVFEAVEMEFNKIDPILYDEIVNHWDDHDLNEYCSKK